MSSLPTGTVTFLFTDIEGSTTLWERNPQSMAAALKIHNTILRKAIEANGGEIFKIKGDEFNAAFPTAPQALVTALETQRNLLSASWNELGPLKVRMGIHTGEAHLDEDGDEYAVSHTKNRVSRIMSAGHGGQILLSQESRDLCARNLPSGVVLQDLGEQRVKGMLLPEHFYQAVALDLPKDFPPLLTQAEPRHNLPVQLTSFIGREKEIERVEELLQKNRLVTLTGPGGTGKTRLSQQVAADQLECYPDGAWMVELAPVGDPALVVLAAAQAVGMHLASSPHAFSFLENYLRSKHLLLILDNCEHLIEACARLADSLLHTCPHLHILASSRESLGIEGETSYRVPPLPFPDVHELPSLEQLEAYAAIRLFVERAQSASLDFQIRSENAPTVAQICQRLDGIPLAIELAAARVKILQVEEIAERLDDRFRLLTGGSRAALPRYQTLRASIDWSYELLSPAERALLQRLSVFAGSWVLKAAEYVGCGQGIESCEALDVIGRLANKSLIFVEGEMGSTTRYRMLETIRQYAHEKLIESGQAKAARDKHLLYYVELAEKVEWQLRGPDQAFILNQLEAELDNLRLALGWSLEVGNRSGLNPELGLRLAAALFWYWHLSGRHAEALEWLERLLATKGEERGIESASLSESLVLAKALGTAGNSAFFLGKDKQGLKMHKESIALYHELGSQGKRGYAYALLSLGENSTYQGDSQEAKSLLEQSLTIFKEEGDKFGIGECLHALGEDAVFNRKYTRAKDYFEETSRISKEIGDRVNIAYSLLQMGLLAFYQGNFEKARLLWEDSQRKYPEIRDVFGLNETPLHLGSLDWMEGKYALALSQFEETLSMGHRHGNVNLIFTAISFLGNLALSQGDFNQAAHWFEENLVLCRKYALTGYSATALCDLGSLAWAEGDEQLAEHHYTEALAICRESGYKHTEASSLFYLGKVKFAQRYDNLARAYFQTSLASMQETAYPMNIAYLLEAIAYLLAADQQQMHRAARLLGASQTWCMWMQLTRSPRERRERESAIAALREALGEEAFTFAWAEGKAMTMEQAVAYALEDHE